MLFPNSHSNCVFPIRVAGKMLVCITLLPSSYYATINIAKARIKIEAHYLVEETVIVLRKRSASAGVHVSRALRVIAATSGWQCSVRDGFFVLLSYIEETTRMRAPINAKRFSFARISPSTYRSY